MIDMYFKDDIVEILNLSYNDIEDIKNQICNDKREPNKEIVGMRYKIESVMYHPPLDKIPVYRLKDWNQGGHGANIVAEGQISLYKRPLKNWVKWLINKIKWKQNKG